MNGKLWLRIEDRRLGYETEMPNASEIDSSRALRQAWLSRPVICQNEDEFRQPRALLQSGCREREIPAKP
jgi:hypothetical protein